MHLYHEAHLPWLEECSSTAIMVAVELLHTALCSA